MVEEQGFVGDYESEMRCKDGTTFPAEQSVTLVGNETGQPAIWVHQVRNLSRIKQAEAELRHVSQRILEAQEGERLRVARELHDGVNQVLASVKMRLLKVKEQTTALGPAAREILARCKELLLQALEENRRIAHDLRPTDLDQLGLPTTCRNLFAEFEGRTGLKIRARFSRLCSRLAPAVELNLYRIVQEALTNVERHARAKAVRVSLAGRADQLVLRISDDGRGFDVGKRKRGRKPSVGIGLTNMRERAALLGGTCEVKSAANRGTTITVRVQRLSED